MRVEADHGGGDAERAGLFDGLADDGLMAKMHAVEGAHGGRGAAQVGGQVAPAADDLDGRAAHGVSLWQGGGDGGRGRWPLRP